MSPQGWGEKVGHWSTSFVAFFGDCLLGDLSIYLGSPRPAPDLGPVWDPTHLSNPWGSHLTLIPSLSLSCTYHSLKSPYLLAPELILHLCCWQVNSMRARIFFLSPEPHRGGRCSVPTYGMNGSRN